MMTRAYTPSGFAWLGPFVILGVVAGCGPAESRENPEGQALAGEQGVAEAAPPTVPAGTQMTFRLGESLSTASHETGDRFRAEVVADVRSADGDLLVPAGTRADGVVAFAQESPSADEPAVLQLRLASLEIAGETRPFEATTVDASANAGTRDSGGETAAKIAVGTAAGALLGRVLGRDREGAVIGAGAGAVAGAVFAVTTNEGHATISEGATVTVVLDEPLVIR
jgi:hypothetical protein